MRAFHPHPLALRVTRVQLPSPIGRQRRSVTRSLQSFRDLIQAEPNLVAVLQRELEEVRRQRTKAPRFHDHQPTLGEKLGPDASLPRGVVLAWLGGKQLSHLPGVGAGQYAVKILGVGLGRVLSDRQIGNRAPLLVPVESDTSYLAVVLEVVSVVDFVEVVIFGSQPEDRHKLGRQVRLQVRGQPDRGDDFVSCVRRAAEETGLLPAYHAKS